MKKTIIAAGLLLTLTGCDDQTASQYSSLTTQQQYIVNNNLTEEEKRTLETIGLENYIELEKNINELESNLFTN